MIIWLASYPKSGNTFMRSLLSSYYFSKDGNFEFDLLREIQQFPLTEIFQKIGVDIKDKYSVPEFIKNNSEIMKKINAIENASIEDGGSGAFYIYLKKK